MHSKLNNFKKINVIDACAILNVSSSKTLFMTAFGNGFSLCCTEFVHYECFNKPRTTPITSKQSEHCQIIKELIDAKRITVHGIPLECLNDIEVLRNRKKLGKGELSSIAFAKNIHQAFLTDDQGARKIGNEVLGEDFVQTTPQLFAYLIFHGFLLDSHKNDVINEHELFDRPLKPHFEKAYMIALEYRLLIKR